MNSLSTPLLSISNELVERSRVEGRLWELFLDRVEGRAAPAAGNYFQVGSKVEADGELGWGLAGIGSRWDGISLGRGLAALRRPIGG